MQHLTRFTLSLLLVVALTGAVRAAKTDAKQAEYKRTGTDYYLKADVLKAFPNAVILDSGSYTQKGDSYFYTPKSKAPQDVYIQVQNDWIEPITPPTMPTSLGVAADAMQIREPQGDVQIALPTAPANFIPATDKMDIPNGTVVKTGANGTAAVLIGGVDSVRFIPNSSAAVQQTYTPQLRTTEIDLTAGAVFSKVGKRIGEKQDYKVHTPFGVAAARGTDFVTVCLPARVDVWIAQGTVELTQPDGKPVGTVTSEGIGALKIIRFPVMPNAQDAMMASSQTMTAAFNFIPTVNVYVKELQAKMAQGTKLTPNERDYLNRIKKVPALIKLSLVAPPAPAPAPAPTPAPKPAVPAAPPAPATPPPTLQPINLDLRTDGKVDFQGSTCTVEELKPKLEELGKATPLQPITINGREKVSSAQLKKITGLCKAAKLTKVTVAKAAPLPPPVPAKPATPAPATAVTPAPSTNAATATPPASTNSAPGTIPPASSPAKPLPPAMLLPINLDIRPNGKVDFKGENYNNIAALKPKLEEIGKATPDQPIVLNHDAGVKRADIKKAVALCVGAGLTKVTIVDKATKGSHAEKPASPPPVASSSGTSTVASSAAVASLGTTKAVPDTPKPAVSHVPASSAPISVGPNYTVP